MVPNPIRERPGMSSAQLWLNMTRLLSCDHSPKCTYLRTLVELNWNFMCSIHHFGTIFGNASQLTMRMYSNNYDVSNYFSPADLYSRTQCSYRQKYRTHDQLQWKIHSSVDCPLLQLMLILSERTGSSKSLYIHTVSHELLCTRHSSPVVSN